jgi:WD40 repeat protein
MKKIIAFCCFSVLCCQFALAQITLNESKVIESNGYMMEAQYSPFQTYFAYTSDKNKVFLFDQFHNLLYSHVGDTLYDRSSCKIAFSPNEKYLLIGRFNSIGDIAVYNLISQKVEQLITAHSDRIVTINFNQQGNRFVSTSIDNSAKIFELKDDKWIEIQEIKGEKRVYDAVFSYKDEFLILCGEADKISVYQQSNDVYEPLQTLPTTHWGLNYLDVHPYENTFIAGTSDQIWEYQLSGKNFTLQDSLKVKIGRIKDAKYSPDVKSIVLADGSIIETYLKQKNGWTEGKKFPRHNAYILSLNYSLDGKRLISCGEDHTAIIWNVKGISGSNFSKIVAYLGNSLTFSQKSILTEDFSREIIKGLDKNLAAPKDEFETSKEYWERLLKARSVILAKIQEKQEATFGFSKPSADSQAKLKLKLKKYDADKEIYHIAFCNTEATVAIPRAEAKELRANASKALIAVNKIQKKDDVHFEYSNFRVIHPSIKKTYEVNSSENPFNFEHLKKQKAAQNNTTSSVILPNNTTAQNDSVKKQTNYALLIAIGEYDAFDNLINPTIDVGEIAKDLSQDYGFVVEVLSNPKLDDILKKLKTYAMIPYGENDQLFIFFAGHGYYDDVFKEGYLIAKDSKADDIAHTSFLSHSNLRTVVNNIPCEHIFLSLDACFGGTFDPIIASASRSTGMYKDVEKEDFIERKMKYKTRLYLSSGGKEYVPDGRPGQHSPFTRKFLEALRSYGGEDGVLTINEILSYIEKVDPQPRFGEFGNNEPGSDFLFIKK